ncbi:MAG: hypothetical protein EBT47_06425, partial [Chloroflexi bacterium]|nr:hypothetical protein [Chloroflexota bacterium]
PAGIGPEVTVRALSDKSVRSCARVVVIGDRKVLAEACRVTGVDVPWHIVTNRHDVVSADDSDDRASLLDMSNVAPAAWQWGRLSAEHGQASLDYFDKALELVDDGTVSGVVTAPINKEATSLAGCKDLGHMELLARAYAVRDHATMLVSGRLRCVHVSTHYSLTRDDGRGVPQVGSHFTATCGRCCKSPWWRRWPAWSGGNRGTRAGSRGCPCPGDRRARTAPGRLRVRGCNAGRVRRGSRDVP